MSITVSFCGEVITEQSGNRLSRHLRITMEAPDIGPTDIAVQLLEKRELLNERTYPSNPSGDSAMEYSSTQGSPLFVHPKGRHGGRRITQSSVLFVSVLALAASITMVLIWSALCQTPGNKAGMVGLVQRRLSYSQHGYAFSDTAHSCAVLETDLKALQSNLRRVAGQAWRDLTFVPGLYGSASSSMEAAPCFPQASIGTTFSPLRGVGDTYTSTVTDALGQQDVSELPLEPLRWTEPMAHVLEQATAPQHPGEPALRSSAGKWKEDGGDFPRHPWFTPSWVPYDVSHRNHFGSRATGFDATLRQSRSACERTETRKETVLGEAAQLNLQHIIGGSSLPMGEADVASVVPGSDAAKSPQDLMPVETDPVNLPEMADDQTTATAFRSRKIAEIANMLSRAAEEFERGLKGVQERLEPVPCGQFIAQGKPQGDAPVQRILSQSPMCSSGAGCGASQPIQPLMMSSPAYSGDSGRLFVDENAGATQVLTAPRSSIESVPQQSLHQHDETFTVSADGEPIGSLHSSASREHSVSLGGAASPWGNLLTKLHLGAASASDSNAEDNQNTRACSPSQGGNANVSHSATLKNMLPAKAAQETPICGGQQSLAVSVSEASSKDPRTEIAVNTPEHPYVRLPVVPREAIQRTFDYRTALFCSFHDRSACHTLAIIRTLFAKDVLGWIDVNRLLLACQRLVNYAFFVLKWPYHLEHPYRASGRLGLIFLTFDAVVCTMELLGDNMVTGVWWGKFISTFNTKYRLRTAKRFSPVAAGQADLCNRLLAAIEIYKTGRRPSPEVIIVLKRLLFCSRFSPDIFRRPQWDVWRLDDKDCSAV